MERPPFVSNAGVTIFCVAVVILMYLAAPIIALDANARRVYEAEQIALARAHQLRVIAVHRGCDCKPPEAP
jgi:hypothetical protein